MLKVNLKIMPQIRTQMHLQLHAHGYFGIHLFLAFLLFMIVLVVGLASVITVGCILANRAVVGLGRGVLATLGTLYQNTVRICRNITTGDVVDRLLEVLSVRFVGCAVEL